MKYSAEKHNPIFIKLTLWALTVLVLLPFCWLIKTAGPDYLKGIDNLFHAQDGIVLTWLRNSAITTLGALLLSVI